MYVGSREGEPKDCLYTKINIRYSQLFSLISINMLNISPKETFISHLSCSEDLFELESLMEMNNFTQLSLVLSVFLPSHTKKLGKCCHSQRINHSEVSCVIHLQV